jgi:ABC-type phosphate transport system auxiliary subunit
MGPLIIDGEAHLSPDAIPALLEQIDELLAEPSELEEPETLARIERTLTDGYAYALALEAERWRLERRLSELAGELHDGNQELKAKELAQLSGRLSNNANVLTGLRGTLMQLRARATAVRSRAPMSASEAAR